MLKKIISSIVVLLSVSTTFADAMWISARSNERQPTSWNYVQDANANKRGAWVAFRKNVDIEKVPSKLLAKIAVDSKYWLWINGKLAVFEGGLKRGPNPQDGYYDEIDIAPFLTQGKNQIAVLVWFFGREGFSHKSSGKLGLFFEAQAEGVKINSDSSWFARVHPAYSSADNPPPNYRLAESNICFDARKDIPNWQTADNLTQLGFLPAFRYGYWGSAPWNNHQKRPIPMWKNFGVKDAEFTVIEKAGKTNKTVIAKLPYNMQMTPIITLFDHGCGAKIDIQTDHSHDAVEVNLRAEYITKHGKQTYESLGWMNGQQIILNVPNGVDVLAVQYRETGYNTEILRTFSCSDDFYNRFWKKAQRTLYVNIRDNFFDCPERERGQWWGDTVLLMGEAFYTLTPSSHQLMRKAIRELVAWQKPNGVLYAPTPAGNWFTELPAQILSSVGRYGFWNYYMNTGDIETIAFAYPHVKKYLSLWELDKDGFTAERKVDWKWGDWGQNKDYRLLFGAWHYMALEAAANMADALNKPQDAVEYRKTMASIKIAFNKYWDGKEYRHPTYKELTDDRAQALAVLSGIADESKYNAIYKFLQNNFHASAYMEKYVMEALFVLGQPEYALERAKKRYGKMVDDPNHTTLYESWEIGGDGGGSTNHAWSGGALTVISQYLCGLYPLEPAWKTFKIEPTPASFKNASIAFQTVSGEVKSSFKVDGKKFYMEISVPKSTSAVLYLPTFTKGKQVKVNGSTDLTKFTNKTKFQNPKKQSLLLPAGEYKIEM